VADPSALLRKQIPLYPVDYLIISIYLFCFLQGQSSLSLQMNRFLFFGLGYLSFPFHKLSPAFQAGITVEKKPNFQNYPYSRKNRQVTYPG
jgi:hypothetical protein